MNLAALEEDKGRFYIVGPLTFATITTLYQDLLQRIKSHPGTSIVLDLERITNIDSAGIALFVVLDRKAQVRFVNLKQEITNLMSLYGVDWLQLDSDELT